MRAPFVCFTLLCLAALPARSANLEPTSTAAATGPVITAGPRQTTAEAEDIGEIKEAPAPTGLTGSKFNFAATARAEFTTNGTLSGSSSKSDVIFWPSIEGSYSTGLGHGFGFAANAIVETGAYADRTERSFVGYDLQTTIDWKARNRYSPRFFVGAEPYRYDSYDRGGLITEAVGVIAGADWGYHFRDGRTYLFVGYTMENYFADPSIDNRLANRAVVGISTQLAQQIFAQIYYQYQYTDYRDLSRYDSRHVGCFNLIWQIDEKKSLTLSEAYVSDDSTVDVASYQAATTSIAFSLQF